MKNTELKKYLLLTAFVFCAALLKAQKVDSIYFHLYTDSLKKGTHNYINVDGKLSNGKWFPLSSKEILFSSSAGKFEGNDLVLPAYVKEEKVTVTAVLKSNPAIRKEVTIYIKTTEDPDLPKSNQLLKEKNRKNRKSR